MIQLLRAGLAVVAMTNAPPSYDAAAWRADFVQMRTELQARYVNLAWMGSYESGVDVPSMVRRTDVALGAARSDAEAGEALRAFISAFHDGHLSELATLEPSNVDATEPDKVALNPDDPISGCAAMGYASTASVAFSLPLAELTITMSASGAGGRPLPASVHLRHFGACVHRDRQFLAAAI